MTASLNVADGVLRVEGTDAADQIHVRHSGGTVRIDGVQIAVTSGGITTPMASVARGQIVKIEVAALDGNDVVMMHDTVQAGEPPIAMAIHGASGNDTLTGGEGADSIFGGGGVDSILGGAGEDALYGHGNPGAPPVPMSLYSGEGNAADSTGGNHGTIQGDVTFVPGLVGQAFDFDGVEGYVDLGTDTSLDLPGSMSVSMWIRLDTLDNAKYFLADFLPASGNTSQGSLGTVVDGSTFAWVQSYSDGTFETLAGTTPIQVKQWFHLAAVRDDGAKTVRLYVNGVEDASLSYAGKTVVPLQGSKILGGSGPAFPGDFMDGQLDEVGIYNRALPLDQIQALYLTGSADDGAADHLNGQDGDDYLNGGEGNDYLDGRVGNDTLDGLAGNDTLFGWIGNDSMLGGEGDDYLNGQQDHDWMNGQDGIDEMYGFTGNDTLFGWNGNDTIYAGAGNDYANGQQDNDWINGQEDHDQIIGFDGRDSLYGATGNDTIYGGAGDDYMDGQQNSDTMDGQEDNDTLFGNTGADWMNGSSGKDTIYGGTNNDTLYGGFGNDVLDGQDGNDTIDGQDDNDYLIGHDGADWLYGNLGNDYAYGGFGNDSLYGGFGNDQLDGQQDNDTLDGQDNNDTLIGFSGRDWLNGGFGKDSLFGGFGDDSLYGGFGTDLLDGQGDADTLDGQENDDTLQGSSGADRLYGGLDNDILYGGEGTDSLYGASGNDFLDGNENNDHLEGQENNDTLIGSAGVDYLLGGSGDDSLWGAGLMNSYNYQDASNYLFGEAGNDNLYGGNGSDNLYGGENNDGLFGGVGRNDRVNGGAGADRFLQLANNEDTIQDAAPEDAILRLEGQTVATYTDDLGTYSPRAWSDRDVARLDKSLVIIHMSTGNDILLETAERGQLSIVIHGGDSRGFNDGKVHLTDANNQFGAMDDTVLGGYVLHEIGHNWNGPTLGTTPNGVDRWANFSGLSGWTNVNPNSDLYVEVAGKGWWHLKTAVFASNYGEGFINEDWCESFSAYFAQRAGWTFYNNDKNAGKAPGDPQEPIGAAAIPAKIALIDEWVRSR